MDRFCPTGKVLKKLVHLLRWTTFPHRTVRILVEWIAPLVLHGRDAFPSFFRVGNMKLTCFRNVFACFRNDATDLRLRKHVFP